MASQNNNDSNSSGLPGMGLLDKLLGLVTDKMGIALILALLLSGAVGYVVLF